MVAELTINTSLNGLVPTSKMGLSELETLRLILRGGSVIDWRRLSYRNRDEVEAFLRQHYFKIDDPSDQAWVRRVLEEAVDYLRTAFDYRVASGVADPAEIHDLFLYASGAKEPQKWRRIACIVLKVMHVIHHIEGRELLYQTPISEADLFRLIDEKVLSLSEEMRQLGYPIAEFVGNVKMRSSIITKLLAKKETVAAQVFDKVRYRIVTKTIDDILPVLLHLSRSLFPYNLVVPSQTENTLVRFRSVVEKTPELRGLIGELQSDLDLEDLERRQRERRGEHNRFSGSSYKVLNFVVDMPVRIDGYLPPRDREVISSANKVVFGLVEFQMVDEATARANDDGENSHERYKRRQKRMVLRRLSRGLVVPKGTLNKSRPGSDSSK
jgi:uncharacterized protein (TIGR04552 family)